MLKKSIMKELVFKKIDAFATDQSTGNPAGAIYLNSDSELNPTQMQRIAAELKGFVNEVGYISRLDAGTFMLKYYSSEKEVEFCGHATIAIMYDLLKDDTELLSQPTINIVTSKGRLLVQNRIPDEDAVFISAPHPHFPNPAISGSHIAEALGASVQDLCTDYPVEVINAGLETLIVPIRTLQTILGLQPDFKKLKLFCENHSIDIVEVFSKEASDVSNCFRTRVFAPRFGYLEDPATGSGNAAFGYYLLKHKKWNGEVISIEQNDKLHQPNIIKLSTRHGESGNVEVTFGGRAIVRIKGTYFLV
ncbi:MAG TPA: PhzF family phenazine biosynthesis protein [Smithellaceae bacterium]|nr:PhzF family phenazine biosynthesis protein [Smithellaceae bacterium]